MKKTILSLVSLSIIFFSQAQEVQLNLKVMMEGAFFNGQMTPFLNVLGELPLDQPYNNPPFNYGGTESVASMPNSNIVDWILVDVLKYHPDIDNPSMEIIGRKAGFILKDGQITDIDGISYLSFDLNGISEFYVRVMHRNHLSIISAVPFSGSESMATYDFTTGSDKTLGQEHTQKLLGNDLWGMIAADGDASGQIDNRDKNEVWLLQNGMTGYLSGDFNMDTQVDEDDKIVKWEFNVGRGSYPIRDTILPIFICGSSTVMFGGIEYGTVIYDNKCWLDRNLGADQVATAYNDALSFGDLFQWGRLIDGHQIRISPTTTVLSAEDIPGHGDFILVDDDPYDWRNPQNSNLWQETANINNPCPDGWRVPSLAEWQEASVGWANRTDAFNSLLKLPAAGWRSESGGNVSNAGSWGNYWSTTINATGSQGIYFDSFNFSSGTYARASGRSVRCLKSSFVPNTPPDVPSTPNPPDGATGIEPNTDLSWVCSDPNGDDLTYDIYFGINPDPALVETNFSVNTWSPGLLNLNTTYYWKVVAFDIYGEPAEGAVWSFTTRDVFECGDILVDDRDGQSYNTVQIGEQCWMSENINIGTMILGEDDMANDGIVEKYCHGDNPANCDTYGGLYQWDELMEYTQTEGTQGICPEGWHIPTDDEFCSLTSYVDPTIDCNFINGYSGTDGGYKLKSTSGWNLDGNGSDQFGFTAIPGGSRYASGDFVSLGISTWFWSSTEALNSYPWDRHLTASTDQIGRWWYNNTGGLSLRCLKDAPSSTWSCGDPLFDERDDQEYSTVQISEQCWMAENLNIGLQIDGINDQTNNSIIEKYCFDDIETNCNTYGGLYQWDETMAYSTIEGSQGICPEGWHVPTDSEWFQMENYLDPTITLPDFKSWRGTDGGTKLKTGGSSGFNALFGGQRNYSGDSFTQIGFRGLFQTSTTEFSSGFKFKRIVEENEPRIYRNTNYIKMGGSVRCIMNN